MALCRSPIAAKNDHEAESMQVIFWHAQVGATQQVEDAQAALPLPEDPILELIRQKENEY